MTTPFPRFGPISAPALALAAILMTLSGSANAEALPEGFVRLSDHAPAIEQDIRYFGDHNFVGRPIVGYEAPECILSAPAAEALSAVAEDLALEGLGLKIYDCYRPARAVADFAAWARDLDAVDMQNEFYPRVAKTELFDLGYIANRSGHSRGSTVDLAIKQLDAPSATAWKKGEPLADCTSSEAERFADGILDFGTGYDCFDPKAHHGASDVSDLAAANRAKLADAMAKHGFRPYAEEWWHYTLADEPFPDTYFDFPVTAAPPDAQP